MARVRSEVGERWSRLLLHITQQDVPEGNSRWVGSVAPTQLEAAVQYSSHSFTTIHSLHVEDDNDDQVICI